MCLVSIIIPTYNDWHRLSLCLKALSEQSMDLNDFEIIVVNNNANDKTPDDYFIPVNCTVLVERKPGSYAARNAALKIAKGEVIGFTDSDCIPDKDWISNAYDYLDDNSRCTRIAGRVKVFSGPSKPNRAELYDKLYAFNQKGYVSADGTSVTANLFTYKYLFNRIGLFDENLMSGGDYKWGTLAHSAGYKIDYVESVLVHHPARASLEELLKKEKRVGGGQAIFLKKNSHRLSEVFAFIYELRPRLGELKFILKSKEELSLMDKLNVFLIRQNLLAVRAYEKLRVQMGKQSNRA
jgi:glycosyltransferase involved in cell wall biosynthesis